MPSKKKRTVLSWIPTDRNQLILENMGILNKHGRSTGRVSLNDWLNRLVHEKYGVDDSSQNNVILERVLISEMNAIQEARKERDKKDESKLSELKNRLDKLRNQKKMEEYYETDKKSKDTL